MAIITNGWRALAIAGVIAIAAGCSPDDPAGGPAGCTNNTDCATGSICRDGFCVVPDPPKDESDAGIVHDGGTQDSDGGTSPDGGDAGTPPDETPPTIEILSPQPDEAVSGEVQVTIRAGDGEGEGVERVEISLNAVDWIELERDAGQYSATLPLEAKDHERETLTVRAVDRAGNVATTTQTFFNDSVAPNITLTPPSLTVANRSHLGTELTFSGTVTDGSGEVDSAEYSFDGDAWEPLASPSAFSVKYPVPDQTESSIVLHIRAVDAAGNAAGPITSAPIRIDTIAPTWSFTSPAEGQLFTLADPATLRVEGSSSSQDVESIQVQIDGTVVHTAASSSVTRDFLLADDDGDSHELAVIVTDKGGNSVRFTRTYQVDRVPPKLAITSPGTDYACTGTAACTGAVVLESATSLTISGTVSDGGGLSALNPVRISIGSYESGVAQLGSGQAWSFDWVDLPSPNGEEVVVTVTAVDANGNTSTAARKLWVDRVSPKATALLYGKRRVDLDPNLISFDEPMVVDSVRSASSFRRLSDSVVVANLTLESTDGMSFRVSSATPLQPYTAYEYTLGSNAHDRAGNPAASISQKFHTDQNPPGITIAAKGSKPRLHVDGDGKPLVIHWDGIGFTVARWNGDSAYVKHLISTVSRPDYVPCSRPFFGEISDSPNGNTLALTYDARVLYCERYSGSLGGSIYHSRATGAPLVFEAPHHLINGALDRSTPRTFLYTRIGGPDPFFTRERRAAFQTDQGLEYKLETADGKWSTPQNAQPYNVSGTYSGRVVFSTNKLMDAFWRNEIVTMSTGQTITTAHSDASHPNAFLVDRHHALWATSNSAGYGVSLGCGFASGPWKLGTASGITPSARVVHAEVRLKANRVLYVFATENDEIYYASHTDVTCNAAPPAMTWRRIPGVGRAPSIDLDVHPETGAETFMIAYEDPSSGALLLYTDP